MFKKFLSAFLGSMAAIWLSALIIIVASMVFIVSIIGKSAQSAQIKEHSILKISLNGSIDEREQPIDVKDLVLNGLNEDGITLEKLLAAVYAAKDDANIDGIFLDCQGSELGYASRQELIAALNEFKKSGKWIYAYGDAYTQGDYYVSSTATRIFLNPVGQVYVTGIGVVTPFFKNALDKLGVKAEVFKVGTFKSAVEPFLLTEMSEPSRLQTQVFIDDIWNEVKSTISQNRGVVADSVQSWATNILLTKSAEECLKLKVVDELAYSFEFEDKLKKLTQCDNDTDLNFVSAADYVSASNSTVTSSISTDEPHVAVLYAFGDIVDEGNTGIVSTQMVPEIIKLSKDENVKGLVLRVNSGGGSAFASEQIWKALEVFKKTGKPFYVSMGDYAASGGYYISCGADVIYADRNTITGSIGIFGLSFCAQDLLSNKLGVNYSMVTTNPNAVFQTYFTEMTDAQKKAMQANVENGYKLFTSRVATGRKMAIDSLLTIAEGRVWAGTDAMRIHLIDKFGTLKDAVNDMTKKLNLESDKVMSYPNVTRTPIEELILNSGIANVSMPQTITIEGVEPKEITKYFNWIERIKSMSAIQARMQDISVY